MRFFSTRFLALPEASRTLPEAPKWLAELPKAQNDARLEHVENEKNVRNLKSSFVREHFFFSFWKCQKLKKCSKNDKSAQKWSKVLKKWPKVNEKPSKHPLSWRVQSWEWSHSVRKIISRLMGCFPLDFEFFASGGSYGPGTIKTVVNMPTAIILRFDSSKSMAWASS